MKICKGIFLGLAVFASHHGFSQSLTVPDRCISIQGRFKVEYKYNANNSTLSQTLYDNDSVVGKHIAPVHYSHNYFAKELEFKSEQYSLHFLDETYHEAKNILPLMSYYYAPFFKDLRGSVFVCSFESVAEG